jgi:hypothetical protein
MYVRFRLGSQKRPRWWEDDIKRDLREIGCGGMRSDNKVRELAAVCLPWQQWTGTSVWFDDWTNSQPRLLSESTEKAA